MVEYTYDAWGNVLSITGQYASSLGKDNPIRYRGYYYDSETGFYYLQSRYYDPAIRRFISADDPELLGANGTFIGYNLYAYCDNNPVNNSDPSGHWIQYVVGAAVGGILGFVFYVIDCYNDSSVNFVWWKAVGQFAIGAASGALAATGAGIFSQIAANVVLSVAALAFDTGTPSKDEILTAVCKAILIGAIAGIAGGAGIGQGKHIKYIEPHLLKNLKSSAFKSGLLKNLLKAFKYAFKATKTIFVGLIRSIGKATIWSNVAKYGFKSLKKVLGG